MHHFDSICLWLSVNDRGKEPPNNFVVWIVVDVLSNLLLCSTGKALLQLFSFILQYRLGARIIEFYAVVSKLDGIDEVGS